MFDFLSFINCTKKKKAFKSFQKYVFLFLIFSIKKKKNFHFIIAQLTSLIGTKEIIKNERTKDKIIENKKYNFFFKVIGG